MSNLLNEKAIKEAAYYIWKNAGCPANTSMQDWNAAIQQLTSSNNSLNLSSKKSSNKTSSCKTASMKKTSASAKSAKTTKKAK